MERMSDKRLSEIEGLRLRPPEGSTAYGDKPPLPGTSELTEELLTALNQAFAR